MHNEDPREGVAAICVNAGRFAHLLDTLPPDAWAREGTRLEDDSFDVALLARFALHEVRHHRFDAEHCALANT
jgi:hypothetical protein